MSYFDTILLEITREFNSMGKKSDFHKCKHWIVWARSHHLITDNEDKSLCEILYKNMEYYGLKW